MFILSQAKNEEHTHTLTLCPSLQHFLLYLAPTFSCSSPFHSTLTHLEYIDLLLSPSSFSLPLLIPPPLLCLILHFFYHRPSPFTTALTPSLHPHQFRLMSSRFSWMILPHTYHTHKGLHTHTPHTQRITCAHTRKIHGPRTRIHTPHEQTPRRRKSNI